MKKKRRRSWYDGLEGADVPPIPPAPAGADRGTHVEPHWKERWDKHYRDESTLWGSAWLVTSRVSMSGVVQQISQTFKVKVYTHDGLPIVKDGAIFLPERVASLRESDDLLGVAALEAWKLRHGENDQDMAQRALAEVPLYPDLAVALWQACRVRGVYGKYPGAKWIWDFLSDRLLRRVLRQYPTEWETRDAAKTQDPLPSPDEVESRVAAAAAARGEAEIILQVAALAMGFTYSVSSWELRRRLEDDPVVVAELERLQATNDWPAVARVLGDHLLKRNAPPSQQQQPPMPLAALLQMFGLSQVGETLERQLVEEPYSEALYAAVEAAMLHSVTKRRRADTGKLNAARLYRAQIDGEDVFREEYVRKVPQAHFALVMDVSGSMTVHMKDRPMEASTAALQVTRKVGKAFLDVADAFDVVATVDMVAFATNAAAATQPEVRDFLRDVNKVPQAWNSLGGGTDMAAGVRVARSLLEGEAADVEPGRRIRKLMMLITDGEVATQSVMELLHEDPGDVERVVVLLNEPSAAQAMVNYVRQRWFDRITNRYEELEGILVELFEKLVA